MQNLIDGLRARARGARSSRIAVLTLMLSFSTLALGSACSGNTKEDQDAEPVQATMLKVNNQAFLDMTIYVYRSSQRIRLGTANGNSTSRFVIPSNLIFGSTPLRFQADPIGRSRTPVSQEITVSPGDEVILTIPPSL
jgi:hypothetical protein